ncbi:LacI family DNA-binding transcriptional regulator [Streptomyces sp. NPDC047108]|uniref:LacI family DNA-binding transcriptional regulator n=1 Tax=Streptomyces sp. NPDC047108 TaxID=3155025 RepID=UPI0033D3D10E
MDRIGEADDRNPRRGASRKGRPTLRDVARELGVSAQTVSNAFRRPDQLSPALRSEVLRTARRLGYGGPDPAAKSLRGGRAGALGVLYNDRLSHAFDDPAFMLFLRGLTAAVEQAGLSLLLIPAESPGSVDSDARQMHDEASRGTRRPGAAADRPFAALRTAVVDGIVVYSLPDDDPLYATAASRNRPLVLVDSPRDRSFARVTIDDEAAARAAAEHLIGLGHRQLGVIALELTARRRFGPVEAERIAAATNAMTAARLSGYAAAARAAGLAPESVTVVETEANTEPEGERAARMLLGGDARPTALLAMSDRLAVGAIAAARELGLDIPGDVSVVGFDNVPASASTTPPLTTVDQQHEAKGRQAGECLLAALHDGDAADDSGTAAATAGAELPARLVVRGSTGPSPRSR